VYSHESVIYQLLTTNVIYTMITPIDPKSLETLSASLQNGKQCWTIYVDNANRWAVIRPRPHCHKHLENTDIGHFYP